MNRVFQSSYDARHDLSPQFDSSLNDLDVHSRTQGHGKARSCAVSLL